MTTAMIAQQAIDDFLRQKIQITIEQKQKKAKDSFTQDDIQKIHDEYERETWLNKVAKNVDKLFLNVSHVAKLTHSSSQAMSLRDSNQSNSYPYLITTQTLDNHFLDSGYSDAKVAPIAEFLSYQVADMDKQLGELLAEDEAHFANVSDNVEQRQYWSSQIKQAYQPQTIRSHVLAKQIYIPVGDSYHLVSPMYSSSIAHEIALAVKYANNKDNPAKLARKQQIYLAQPYIAYPNVATLGITKSNHQNVSALNGQRGGLLYLLPTLPPKWETNPNPPTSIKQLLQLGYSRRLFSQVQYLLSVFKENKLFINHERKLLLKELIEDIVYKIFDEIMLIRHSQPSGWAENRSMPMYLRLLLDPQILQNQQFSQPEITAFFDEFKLDIVQWISKGIGDDIRTKSLENLWLKIMSPIMQEFYQTLKAE